MLYLSVLILCWFVWSYVCLLTLVDSFIHISTVCWEREYTCRNQWTALVLLLSYDLPSFKKGYLIEFSISRQSRLDGQQHCDDKHGLIQCWTLPAPTPTSQTQCAYSHNSDKTAGQNNQLFPSLDRIHAQDDKHGQIQIHGQEIIGPRRDPINVVFLNVDINIYLFTTIGSCFSQSQSEKHPIAEESKNEWLQVFSLRRCMNVTLLLQAD